MSIPSVVYNGCSLHQSCVEPTSKTSLSLSWLQERDEDIEDQRRNSKVKSCVYVHPLAKRSASTMNTKSLKMCTESLGSETGSDIICEDEFLLEKQKYEAFSKSAGFNKKMKGKKGSFPPPLTSITRPEGVQVRPFREDGRLVIKAVNITTPTSYFYTQRSNGRLTLSLRQPENEHLESQEEEDDDDEKQRNCKENDANLRGEVCLFC